MRHPEASQVFAPPSLDGRAYAVVPYPQGLYRTFFFREHWLPERFWQGSINAVIASVAATNQTELSGVNWKFADVPGRISGGLPSPYLWRVEQGRDKPVEHCVSEHNASVYALPFGPSEPSEEFGDALYLRLASRCSTLVMFAPRVDGVVSIGGVYAVLRPIYVPGGAAPIVYSDQRLPDGFAVFEIGTVGGGFAPERQRIFPGLAATMRSGLGRWDVLSPDDTRFAVTAYTGTLACSLAFDYVPPHIDATIVAAPTFQQGDILISALSRGFAAASPPALWLRLPDHGRVGNIAFTGGALAYPTWQGQASDPTDPAFSLYWPRNPAWATWEETQFPRTLRSASDGLKPAGASIPSTGAEQTKMPIYDYAVYEDGRWFEVQLHPVRTVEAKCGELDIYPRFTEYDEKAAFLYDQCDDFIFEGKKITGLNVEFVPYLAAATEVPNGTFTPLTVPSTGPFPPSLPFNEDDSELASDRRFGSLYWKANGQVSVPAGADNYGIIGTVGTGAAKEVLFFYSGTVSLFVDAIDGNAITTSQPKGSVDTTIEQTALISLERSTLGVPFEPDVAPGSVYKTGPSSVAPPTGSYDLEPFQIDGIASAPGVFCFVGPGQFAASETFTINRLARWGGPKEWVFFAVVGSRNQYRVQSEVFRETFATTLNVSLATDHIELYAVLGSRLQEGGAYVKPPEYVAGGPETFAEFQERLRDWQLDVWDQPKGKLRDQAVYVEGQEPHALLTLSLSGRTVMRSEATAEADYSSIPGFGGSFATGGAMQPYSSAVVGLGGTGFVSNDTVLAEHHPYAGISYTFSRAQTLALLAGENVELTQWIDGKADPFLMDFGVQFFQYRVLVTATVEDA